MYQNLLKSKEALGVVELHVCLVEKAYDLLEVENMFCEIPREDNNVVNVDENKSKVLEQVGLLEHRGEMLESKRGTLKFVLLPFPSERCVLLVFRADLKLMESSHHVQTAEACCFFERLKDVFDQRQWVIDFRNQHVQGPRIYTYPSSRDVTSRVPFRYDQQRVVPRGVD